MGGSETYMYIQRHFPRHGALLSLNYHVATRGPSCGWNGYDVLVTLRIVHVSLNISVTSPFSEYKCQVTMEPATITDYINQVETEVIRNKHGSTCLTWRVTIHDFIIPCQGSRNHCNAWISSTKHPLPIYRPNQRCNNMASRSETRNQSEFFCHHSDPALQPELTNHGYK